MIVASLTDILVPLWVCISVGVVWGVKGYTFDTAFVSRVIYYLGSPCLIFSSLTRMSIDFEQLSETVCLTLVCLAILFLMSSLTIKLARVDFKATLPLLLFPNTGNMGLPLCFLAFGDIGLSLGISFFVAISIIHFSLVPAMNSPLGGSLVWRVLLNPVLLSSVFALGFIWMRSEPPVWLATSTELLGQLAIPLMLITLGFSLSKMHIINWRVSLLLSSVRIFGGGCVGLLVANFFGLTGVMKGVLLLQFSMPSAVINYLFAQQYQRQPEMAASVVFVSSVISLFAIPFLLYWIQNQVL